ncbi:MAG: serine/threonine-protein kinase [Microcoleaceae cyanobacterium MO_207.B10]|nr:serine/threonine-protein kinase [Microcoleaceae cyanobacterium MO_207.B10]
MNLKAGVILQKGKYTIDGILGQGSFGITYRAIHNDLSQIVVLKTLNESLHHHQDFAKFQLKFRTEAHLLANCQHPNIVKVWDFFEEDELFFMVMDYIPGQNLADLIQSGHNLDPDQAIHYIHQIASALSVVHTNRFLHRDIQPKNIIRRAGTNTVVLTDFGITCDLNSGIRQTHTNLFSVGYAAPEQCNPEQKLTPATDIYALTATFYYLLTGKAPIPAPLRISQVLPETLRIPLNDLKLFLPDIHPALEKSIIKGLEIDAEKRPQTLDKWFAILLDKSNNLDLNKQNTTSKQKSTSLSNNNHILHINKVAKVADVKQKKSPNLATQNINTIKKIHLEKNHLSDYTYAANILTQINQLCLQLTIFLIFVLTAGTFGWIGFDITMRYSHTSTKKTATLTSDQLLENLRKESNSHFRTQEPSSPLFDAPSVKTYSVTPPRLNKMPKPNFYQEEEVPNTWSSDSEDNSTSFPKKQYYSSNSEDNSTSFPEKKYYSSDSQSPLPNYNYPKLQYQYRDDYY